MFVILFFPITQAKAQSIIRDTEIENVFKEWLAPLLQAAGMGDKSVNLILVSSPQVNAFVAGGANIFIYTGLIDKSETPEEIIGVMAHELGHITGGHLIVGRSAMERASYESILGTVLGIGAAIATGNGQLATALSSGASNIAARRYLAHSRVNESSADQAALTFLEKSQINPVGLKTFLQKLESEEMLPTAEQSEYMRTHPVTGERINALETKIQTSEYKDAPIPPEWKQQHARMKAKLMGYIDPGAVVWAYNDKDRSITADYARAVAAYRENKFEESIRIIDGLINAEPNNPYFYELKGEVLLSMSKIEEATVNFSRAVDLEPDASLIRIQLGKALLQNKEDNEHLDKAIEILQRALIDEPRSSTAYRLLATAYGQQGKEDIAKLYLAEEAILQRRYPYAKQLIEGVINTFEQGSKNQIKAQDLLYHIENVEKKT